MGCNQVKLNTGLPSKGPNIISDYRASPHVESFYFVPPPTTPPPLHTKLEETAVFTTTTLLVLALKRARANYSPS